jgi:protease-4
LDDIYSELVADIAESRDMSRSELESIIDKGPFNSSQAESLGLIDGRVYPGELQERLPASLGGSWRALPSDSYLEAPSFQERFCVPPAIVIIPVSGGIIRGESRSSLFGSKNAGSSTISAAIRQCARDRNVKAIVMRLDTPGGDALASDLIWGELVRAREAKPVVVSMSDICASGGYYIASASDRIFLEPTTITGSIGVYAGKVDLSGFNDKLGISTETVKRGKHAGMFSFNSPFSQEERQLLHDQVTYLYRNFVSIVSDNRNLSFDSVDTIARGRVWSGTQALNLGLADEQGSLLDAVAAAAQMARLDEGEYTVTEYVLQEGFPRLPELVSMSLSSLLGDWRVLGVLPEAASISEDGSGTPQYRLPYDLKIK